MSWEESISSRLTGRAEEEKDASWRTIMTTRTTWDLGRWAERRFQEEEMADAPNAAQRFTRRGQRIVHGLRNTEGRGTWTEAVWVKGRRRRTPWTRRDGERAGEKEAKTATSYRKHHGKAGGARREGGGPWGREGRQPAHGERRGWTGPGRGARHPPSEIRAGCRQPGKPQRTRWGAAV